MADTWIVPDQLFDGQNLAEGLALRISDGMAVEVAQAATLPKQERKLTVSGLLTPGFVDVQVNGGGGVLFNHEPNVDGIKKIAVAHHDLGTVAIMPTVITDASDVLEAACHAALAAREMPGFAGIHIEGPHIDPRKRGTHDARYIRPFDAATMAVVQRLRDADITVMITLAPEATSAAQIAQLADLCAIVSLGHSDCTVQEAQSGFAAGAVSVTHLYNAMSQMQGRAPGLVGAAINSDAFVGMICDGVHVADEMLALAIRARPRSGRMFLVSDAMPTVGGPDTFELYGQEISVQNGRLVNAEGNLAGAHTTMAEGVARLVSHAGQDVQTALRMAITTPAALIKAPHLAQITGRPLTDLMVMGQGLQLRDTLQRVIDNQTA